MARSVPTQSGTVEQLRRELQADLLLWEGFLDRLPEDDPMHAILGLRVASIKATLDRTAASDA